jgi:hypothetical protein
MTCDHANLLTAFRLNDSISIAPLAGSDEDE